MSSMEKDVFNQIVSVLKSLYGDDLVGAIFYRIGIGYPQKYGLLVITKKLKTTMPLEEFVIVSQALKAQKVWISVENTLISIMTVDTLKSRRDSPAWREIKQGLIDVYDPTGMIGKIIKI